MPGWTKSPTEVGVLNACGQGSVESSERLRSGSLLIQREQAAESFII